MIFCCFVSIVSPQSTFLSGDVGDERKSVCRSFEFSSLLIDLVACSGFKSSGKKGLTEQNY